MTTRTSAALVGLRWAAPALFAAPAFVWSLFQLQASHLDPLLLALAAGFLAAQLVDGVFDLTVRGVRSIRALLALARGQIEDVIANVRSVHLGLRVHFLVMLLVSAVVWSLVLFALAPAAGETIDVARVAAVAGLLATIGWMFSSYVTARNTQRQNTITLLLNMRHSDVYSRHFNNAYFVSMSGALRDDHAHWRAQDKQARWRKGDAECIPTDEPQSAGPVRSAYQSVIYILNYYEFIAAGVRSGALDAGIVRDTVSAHLRDFSRLFAAWIACERKVSLAAYEHLEWYGRKFPPRRPRKARQR